MKFAKSLFGEKDPKETASTDNKQAVIGEGDTCENTEFTTFKPLENIGVLIYYRIHFILEVGLGISDRGITAKDCFALCTTSFKTIPTSVRNPPDERQLLVSSQSKRGKVRFMF